MAIGMVAAGTEVQYQDKLLVLLEQMAVAGRTSSRYQQFQRSYYWWPAQFAAHCIDWHGETGLTDYQTEILDSLVTFRREAVRGPRGLGKTTVAALAVLWFALTRDQIHEWKVITTAGAWQQLIHYTWPEIHKWARRIKWNLIGRPSFNERTELMHIGLRLKTGEAFALASEVSERIEGAHADQLLFVYDEAKLIPDQIWDSAEGIFAGTDPAANRDAFVLAISTPGEPSGRFYKIHARTPGLQNWHTRHVTLTESIRAGRITQAEVEQRTLLWTPASALFQNQVLGEFAVADATGIIPLAHVEAAIQRGRDASLNPPRHADPADHSPPVLGVDVADAGGDVTVFAERHGNAVTALHRYPHGDTMETTGRIVQFLAQQPSTTVIVDGIGIGAGVVARLAEQSYPVQAFIASGKSRRFDASGQLRFANRRAEAWWHLRELLDPANTTNPILLPDDDELVADLTAPHWRPLSNGRIAVESKEDLRKRIHRSTDVADAVIMAFSHDADTDESGGMIQCQRCRLLYNPPFDPAQTRPCPYCAGAIAPYAPMALQ